MTLPEECAKAVLDAIPLLMQAIRGEMRRQRKPDLSVPQFRTLAFLHHEPGASLSQVADFIGLTLPSMSKLADGLVARGLVARATCPDDRRRLGLNLTAAGKSSFMAARKAAQTRLAELLEPFSGSERTEVVNALRILRAAFCDSSATRQD